MEIAQVKGNMVHMKLLIKLGLNTLFTVLFSNM